MLLGQWLLDLRGAEPGRRGTTSQEKVARHVSVSTGKDITAGTISQIETGRIRAEPETIEAIADAYELAPSTFADYELAMARQSLDERTVGIEVALAALSAYQSALSGGLARRVRRANEQARAARAQRREDQTGA